MRFLLVGFGALLLAYSGLMLWAIRTHRHEDDLGIALFLAALRAGAGVAAIWTGLAASTTTVWALVGLLVIHQALRVYFRRRLRRRPIQSLPPGG
jgi:hypothetical protein